jgi:spermidine synthase
MRFRTSIALILGLSIVGLTYEIAAGRVLAPFFGTSLVTWTAVIATVLAGFSLGNALGGFVAERPRSSAIASVRTALVATALLMALSPTVLGLIYAIGARGTGGMMLAVFLAFFPASVLISLPSPLLAKLAVEARPGREGSSLGLVLAAGSIGAIIGAILAGFVALPLAGSAATFAGCGAATLLCVLFLRNSRSGAATGPPPDQGSVASVAGAGLVIAASMAAGSVCEYESGLSCIDVAPMGNAVYLHSDRTTQAAERRVASGARAAATDGLILPYTQWLWARMDRDLGPAPAVLFIGGGGYTLPTRLLQSRPAAEAVAVEIDPLITWVVRRHLPVAGAMIEQSERGGPRLSIVHEDGRVYINEADRRFDAVVMDAFSSGSVPAHLATRETYERLSAIVDGPVYVNLIDAPDGTLARGIHAILTGLYPHVEAVRGPGDPGERTNIVLAASRSPFDPSEALPAGYETTRIAPGRAFTDDRSWVGHR